MLVFHRYLRILFFSFWLAATTLFLASAAFSATAAMENTMDKTDLLIETNTNADMIHHPALMEFCVHLLPKPENAQSNLALRDVGKLMPWHSHVQPQEVLQAVNRLITDRLAGKEVFYSFYDEQLKKAQTGYDPIASPRIMKKRIDCLKELGIPTEFHLYHHAGHRFGTGKGTDTEHWMDLAVHFWEQQLNR